MKGFDVFVLWRFVPAVFFFSLADSLTKQGNPAAEKYFYIADALVVLALLWSSIVRRTVALWVARATLALRARQLPAQGVAAVRAAAPKVAESAAQGVVFVAEKTAKGSGFLWHHYWLKPWLWTAVTAFMGTIYAFVTAYLNGDWNQFHSGLAILAFLAAPLIVTHLGKWETIAEVIGENVVLFWVAMSAVTLLVTLSHGWWYKSITPFLSLVCAIITIKKWWGEVLKGIGKGLAFTMKHLLEILSGKKGRDLAFVGWGAMLFGIVFLALGAYQAHPTKEAKGFLTMIVTFAVPIFIIGVMVWIKPSDPKKKEVKK